jgi:hypothetical protein
MFSVSCIYLEFFVIYFCQCYFYISWRQTLWADILNSVVSAGSIHMFLWVIKKQHSFDWPVRYMLFMTDCQGALLHRTCTYWNHHCYVTKIICFKHKYWNHHCYVRQNICFRHTYWNHHCYVRKIMF